jgi:ribosome modulation factor
MAALPHNGLELSCPAAQAAVRSFSRILAGKTRSNFPHASRVSCSEWLGGNGSAERG